MGRGARGVRDAGHLRACWRQRLRWRGPPAWRHSSRSSARSHTRATRDLARLLAMLDARDPPRGHRLSWRSRARRCRRSGCMRPGERPQGDVDLLVAPAGMPPAPRRSAIGYVLTHSRQRHTVFVPPQPGRAGFGEHPRQAAHDRAAHDRRRDAARTHRSTSPRDLRRGPRAGANAYATPPRSCCHLLLHAAGNMRATALRYIQLSTSRCWRARLDARRLARALRSAAAARRLLVAAATARARGAHHLARTTRGPVALRGWSAVCRARCASSSRVPDLRRELVQPAHRALPGSSGRARCSRRCASRAAACAPSREARDERRDRGRGQHHALREGGWYGGVTHCASRAG